MVGTRGVDLFRSIDVNAPLAPSFTTRPDPALGIVRQIQAAGQSESQSLQFTLRGQVTRFFNGSVEYTFGRAYNNTSGVGWMPPNSDDLSLEYARADFNQRHRVEMFGSVPMGRSLNAGISMSLATGRPYSLTTGLDTFNEGTGNARPAGVRKRTVTAGVDAFNALNHVNYSYYVGNLSSPFFGQAISAQAPRRVQCSLRVRY